MSASAGAPPPPPPPPPPKGSITSLPAELFLNIIRFLQTSDFVRLALALYPVLQMHGLVPPLTVPIYESIMNWQRTRPVLWLDSPHRRRPTGSNVPLPAELNDHIMDYLEPADRIAWLLSDQQRFQRYFSTLSEDTTRSLWHAIEEVGGPLKKKRKKGR